MVVPGAGILVVSPDAYGYVQPAISALTGGDFDHLYGRPFVYPLIVYAGIVAAGDLSGLLRIQALMYWLTLALLLSVVWSPGLRGRWVRFRALLAAGIAVAYLAYDPSWIMAHYLGPELVYAFLAVLSCVAMIYAYAWRTYSSGTFIAFMCISIVAIWANALVKPQWTLGALFLTMVWLWLLATAPLRVSYRIGVAAAMLVVIVVCLIAPERRLVERFDKWGTIFGPKTLFCNHADLVLRASERNGDIWSGHPAQFSEAMLRSLKEVVGAGTDGWRHLGFNGDRCMYGEAVQQIVNDRFKHDIPDIRMFYASTFLKSVRVEWRAYLGKIWVQTYYAMLHPFKDSRLSLTATDDAPRYIIGRHPGIAGIFTPQVTGEVRGILAATVPAVSLLMRQVFVVLERLAFAIVAAALLYHAVACRKGRCVDPVAFFGVLVFSGAWLGQALTVAVSHSFDVGRYLWPGAPLMIGAVSLSALLIVRTRSCMRPASEQSSASAAAAGYGPKDR